MWWRISSARARASSASAWRWAPHPPASARIVVRQALVIVSSGVAIGLAGALIVARLMDSLLFGIGATDPLTFVSIPVLLALVAVVASYVPARRGSRIDPMLALRHE